MKIGIIGSGNIGSGLGNRSVTSRGWRLFSDLMGAYKVEL